MASIGMRYVVAAPVTSESGDTITYGTKQVLKAVEASLTWELDDSKLYADDAVAETDGSITGYTLDTTVDDLTDAQEAALCGYSKTSSTTEEYEVTDDSSPICGLGYVRVLKKGGNRRYKAVFYPKIQLAKTDESDKTKESSTTWGTAKLHGVGVAHYLASGKNRFRVHQTFDTLASATAYLDGKL